MSVRIKVRSRNLITTVVRDLKFTLKAVEQNRRLIQLTNTEIAERPCTRIEASVASTYNHTDGLASRILIELHQDG